MTPAAHEPVRRGRPLLHEIVVLCLFFALAILLRFPFFFLDVINWDESTFIVMGQSIADGNLPYTVTWDNKPPGGFYLFALVQYLFPESLAAIRLFGALMVGLSGFLCYRVAQKIMPREAAVLSGLLFCCAASLLAVSGQAVMMQHLANPFLLLALILAIRDRHRPLDALLFGALLACAILIRTNLAIVAAIGGAALVLSRWPEGPRASLGAAAWGAFGGLLLLGASVVPFLVSGQLGLYIKSVVTVPLAYSAYGDGLLETAVNLIDVILPNSWDALMNVRVLLTLVFWALGLAGLLLLVAELRLKPGARTRWALVIGFVVVLIATIANRHPWGHYLIQVMPILAIGAAYALWKAGLGSGWRTAPVFLVLLAASAFLLSQPYQVITERLRSGKPLYMGPTYSIVEFLRPRLKEGDTIFTAHHILLYWILDKTPLVPIAAFPENILREKQIVKPLLGDDYTTEKVLNEILDLRPSFLVMLIADTQYTSVPSFARRLEEEYEVAGRQRGVYVLERKDRAK